MPDSPIQQIVCCMGQPVAGNPTQFMMERAFVAADLDWRYLTLEVPPENLGDAVRGLKAMGFRGGNLLEPHNIAVTEHLDELTEAAQIMGAVNCVNCIDDRLVGENTSGKGLVQSLRDVVDPAGSKVAILGAGGTARAIAVELALAGAEEILIVNRTAERGQTLVELLRERVKANARFVHLSGDYSVEPETSLLVNATSIGSADPDARVPLDVHTLAPEVVVADVTFYPPRTRFIRDAESRGCRALDGLGMLVNQGAVAFRIWTGVDPDLAIMREALEEYLEI